jgi:hypothetical protein
MKGTKIAMLTLLLVFSVLVVNADAKWWIFGTSEDEVETSYLFLNKVAFSELGNKVTLYRNMLPMGTITIQGKGTAGKNKVGSVRITLDNKDTWQDVKLSESGAFEFTFRPEIDKTYKVSVEVTDTTGKTNKIENTYKEITVSQIDIQAVVRDALDRMIDAYQREMPAQFMALVADDFAADKVILDRAVRKDFTAFDNIGIRYTLNNVASDATGKVYASLSYSRMVTSTRTGRSFSDKGTTDFTFKVGDKGLKIFSMKIPLIFGLSDASNVATGTVNAPSSDPILLVDSRGNVSMVPFNLALQAINNGSTSPGTPLDLSPMEGFIFISATKVPEFASWDILFFPPNLQLRANVLYLPILGQHIDSIFSVPASGYLNPGAGISITGQSNTAIALQIPGGKYAVVEWSGTAGGVLKMKYKYPVPAF